tara:strand:- start:22450 stop:24387 length:1938 start_codon:yes stop_codon:yes gene_type:complete
LGSKYLAIQRFGVVFTYCPNTLNQLQIEIIDNLEYDVNFLSKRPLNDGQQYNRYFQNSSCKPSYLGNNDTAFTVAQMKIWAYKNAKQTKQLSLEVFSGKNLEQTIAAIYGFLYSHIQYEIDGKNQNLKSPACSWATRERGTDCKSYSIFASTILINLGIKHYLRRVKQPGDNADLWTHVYVVVPKNQKSLKADRPEQYHVIDATVHQNNEVSFSQKSDTLMTKVSLPHYGLQGASPIRMRRTSNRGLAGCNCTPKSKPTPVYAIPVPVSPDRNATTNPLIATIGITPTAATPRTTTNTLVRSNTTVAVAPREATATAISIAEEATPRVVTAVATTPKVATTTTATRSGSSSTVYRLKPSGGIKGAETQQKSGVATNNWVNAGATLLSSVFSGGAQQNAALTQGTKEMRLSAVGQSGTLSSVIQGGGMAAAPYTFGISALVALIPARWMEKTLGQFFKGGFKCIGSTWTEAKARQVAEIEAEDLKAQLLTVIESLPTGTIQEIENNINAFMKYFYSIRSTERDWLNTSAKDCTRDGLLLLIKTMDAGKQEVISLLKNAITKSGHSLVEKERVTVQYPPEAHTGRHALTQQVEQFEIKINPAVYQKNVTGDSLKTFGPSKLLGGINSTTGILVALSLIGGTLLYKNN